jgi:hypothetical protein
MLETDRDGLIVFTKEKDNMTNNDLQNITQKTKGRGTRTTLLKTVSELDCSRRVNLAFDLGLLHGLLEICYSLPVYLINTYHVLNSTSDFM